MLVLSYVSDLHACGWVRSIVPAAAINASSAFDEDAPNPIKVIPKGDISYADWHAADVMVLHRKSTVEWLRYAEEARRRGIALVYEIDDDVWNIPPEFAKPHDFYSADDIRGAMRRIIELCHAIVVSTEELAEVVRAQFPGRSVHVIENAVDPMVAEQAYQERVARLQRNLNRPLIIGWHASQSHVVLDLPIVRNVIPAVLKADQRLRFHVVGWPNLDNWPELRDVHDQVRCEGWVHQSELPFRIAQFDVGIAPLMPNAWNVAKSPQKVLEYGLLEVPAVASPAPCYQRYADTGPGLVIPHENDPAQWYDALRMITTNDAFRAQLGEQARVTVLNQWNSHGRATQWESLFRKVRAECRGNKPLAVEAVAT